MKVIYWAATYGNFILLRIFYIILLIIFSAYIKMSLIIYMSNWKKMFI